MWTVEASSYLRLGLVDDGRRVRFEEQFDDAGMSLARCSAERRPAMLHVYKPFGMAVCRSIIWNPTQLKEVIYE